MPVNPGRLKHRVTIQEAARTNTPGGVIHAWSDVASVWAAVVQVNETGAARYSQAGFGRVTHEVTLRGPRTLTVGRHRFVWRDRVLQVTAPPTSVDNEGRFLRVPTLEVSDGAED